MTCTLYIVHIKWPTQKNVNASLAVRVFNLLPASDLTLPVGPRPCNIQLRNPHSSVILIHLHEPLGTDLLWVFSSPSSSPPFLLLLHHLFLVTMVHLVTLIIPVTLDTQVNKRDRHPKCTWSSYPCSIVWPLVPHVRTGSMKSHAMKTLHLVQIFSLCRIQLGSPSSCIDINLLDLQ